MKKTFILFAVLVFIVSANAQITLKYADYSAWVPETENAEKIKETSVYPNFSVGNDLTWNLDTVVYDTSKDYIQPRVAFTDTINFPGASFSDAASYTTSSLKYFIKLIRGLDSTGIYNYGEQIQRQAISISPLTGGATDSLIILSQNVKYSSRSKIIQFPATIGSTWSTNHQYSTKFTLTAALMGLNNALVQRKSYETNIDSVIGWGKMRVKMEGIGVSTYIPVLMIKSYKIHKDSFYLNGSPAPTPLLSAFGLSQNMQSNVYSYHFYRSGEIMPLVEAVYLDSTFSSTKVNVMFIHKDHLTAEPTTGINEMYSENHISVYPNPIADNKIYINIPNMTNRQIHYKLTNILGQCIYNSSTIITNGTATIETNLLSKSGLIYLHVFDEKHNLIKSLPLIIK